MSALIPFPINPPAGVVVIEIQRVAEGPSIPPFGKISFVEAKV